jgi:hypothetical protein
MSEDLIKSLKKIANKVNELMYVSDDDYLHYELEDLYREIKKLIRYLRL